MSITIGPFFSSFAKRQDTNNIKYLNVWKMKFSLLNLQFRITIMVALGQLVETAICF